jgi:putative alpha-1,2-mannosidase
VSFHPRRTGWKFCAEIRAGGELRFTMQASPNKTWATGVKAHPFSMTGYGK